MKNYLICKIQNITDVDGNILGNRICDVVDNIFPVSDDYEWKEYAEYFDIYTGQWYWADNKPNEYVAPNPQPIPEPQQPATQGTQTL
jgi:hypothetical protein